MEIFIDTANIEEIKRAKAMGILGGVTTNPSLIARAKRQTGKKFLEIVKEICNECEYPVSVEVLAVDYEGMVREGSEIAKIASNVVVKLPCTEAGLKACATLTKLGCKTNLTLCFSATQALLVAKAGATYVSPFVGRIEDGGVDGMQLIADIKMIFMNYRLPTKILVASIRNTKHVLTAALIGADTVTIPMPVVSKLMEHHLTDDGIKIFLEDARQASQDDSK